MLRNPKTVWGKHEALQPLMPPSRALGILSKRSRRIWQWKCQNSLILSETTYTKRASWWWSSTWYTPALTCNVWKTMVKTRVFPKRTRTWAIRMMILAKMTRKPAGEELLYLESMIIKRMGYITHQDCLALWQQLNLPRPNWQWDDCMCKSWAALNLRWNTSGLHSGFYFWK